jgi:hypothetical protein
MLGEKFTDVFARQIRCPLSISLFAHYYEEGLEKKEDTYPQCNQSSRKHPITMPMPHCHLPATPPFDFLN